MKNLCCKDILDLATEYLEDGMEPDAKRSFEAHIERCPPCVTFFKTFKATGHVCRRALAQKIPSEVQKTLWKFLEKRINEE